MTVVKTYNNKKEEEETKADLYFKQISEYYDKTLYNISETFWIKIEIPDYINFFEKVLKKDPDNNNKQF